MRLPFSIFFFTAILYFHFIGFTQDVQFNQVTRSQDDIGSQISAMAQDRQGYLWFATLNGLYKYDGYQFSSYHNEPLNSNSPAFGSIFCIAADKEGYIWLGMGESGLDRLDPATGIFTHFRHKKSDPGSLASDTVLYITQDHEGTIWIGTLSGLDRFDSKLNNFFHYRNNASDPLSISCNVVMDIYEDKQGTLWVGTGTPFRGYDSCGGLNKLNKKTGTFTRYLHNEKDPHSLIDNRVRTIFEDSRGTFWVGTAGDGLHTMDRTTGTFERHLYDPSHPDKLSRPPIKNRIPYVVDHIAFITEDTKGRIWIGTFEGGANLYDPSTRKVTYYSLGKNSDKKTGNKELWEAYKSSDNVIWISTYGESGGELYKILPYQTALPHTRIGKEIHSFAEDDAHTLWIGTRNGLMHKTGTGQYEQFLIDKDSSSASNAIGYILKDNDKFWLATEVGLYLFNPVTKKIAGYHHQPGNVNSLLSDFILTLKKGAGNTLWIGSANGLDLMDTKSGTFTHFQNNPQDTGSISDNEVRAIYTDKKQNFWVGTNKGLNRLDTQTGRFERYLNQITIISILEDKSGTLWCCTTAGLFRYDKEKNTFSGFTDESDIINPSLAVFGITEDQESNLWFTALKGIIRLNKDRSSAVLYAKNQGVNSLALRTLSYTLRNGAIICGDTSGYYEFQPKLLQQNVLPPFVAVSNFLLDNIPVQPAAKGILSAPLMYTKEIRLPYDQNTFSFEFSNIDFISAHEDTRLLYMLQNYDNAWHKAGEERTAYYFNLPPGDYVFKVKALNAVGIAAEKDVAIIITPPWWHTWWAYTIFALLFMSLVWAFIAYRSRALKRENKVLEEKVEHRTEQLKQSLEDLKATQSQLIQSEKMASLGELTAGIAHEIQNPLNFINNFSEVNAELMQELMQENGFGRSKEVEPIAREIKQNLEKITHHGKRADAIVKGMLQHSRTSTSQKELTDINALVDEYLRLSYHGLRAKDKAFNALMKTSFDERIGEINIVPQEIGRVLLNLFNNAFYAVNEKKKQAGDAYEPAVIASTKRLQDKIEISVQDNGMGISKSVQDKIFQPFFTTKPSGEGTGLGLSLSYDIIKAHGGELKVESNTGEGASFTIILSA